MGGFISGNANLSAGSVSTGALADNAVTLAKMAGGTDGNLIGIDASGDPAYIATGTDGQVLTSGGVGVAALMESAGGLTLATEQASTSGTSLTFSSIPAGVKLIFVMFADVSWTAHLINVAVQIGDSGGIETSNYVSAGSNQKDGSEILDSSTAAFHAESDNADGVFNGHFILTLEDSTNHTWISSVQIQQSTQTLSIGAGIKSLSGELTQIQISGGTFDAGGINISYL